ncbi:uncharacterized protein LOC105828928 [Monomorium pharaonis]|uniref:uncharacterized protein LOC105828928 n=1 Tax=Monomorium pharaonis TaxID=307658 RepID=UPI00063F43E9|nr:uncharacterized protein LOC105828928 [Monomorium pharaonis]
MTVRGRARLSRTPLTHGRDGRACALAHTGACFTFIFGRAIENDGDDGAAAVTECLDVRVYARASDRSRAMSKRRTTAMTTTILEPTRTFGPTSLTNGNGSLAETRAKTTPATRFWSKIRLNEWTFSLSLFAFSLAIVLGKLYVNYGNLRLWQIGDRYALPSVTTFTQIYETIPSMSILPKFDMKQLPPDSGMLLNTSNQYAEAAADVLITFYGKYGWLLKAMTSGLVITGFTWFILYKDSSEPGINPPSPFSPSRRRIHGSSRIQINYLVGVLNGILFFVYMCL